MKLITAKVATWQYALGIVRKMHITAVHATIHGSES
jgi:hypothetical protein